MKKYIIITSIFPPTTAVKEFAKFSDWQVIVVGDTKTPKNWQSERVIYLSPDKQMSLGYSMLKELPWKTYARKMIGYAYAIQHGAEVIADTDDDNIPYENWGKDIVFDGEYNTINTNNFFNIYSLFTTSHIWPRGFPLNKILAKDKVEFLQKKKKVGVWQNLADEDPDVDAIYRLTNNTPIFFDKHEKIVLEKNTLCPYNSQNTLFRKEVFKLLYLPAFVSFRYTDILRGLVAQPILWNEDYSLGFGEATVIQKRNPHDYLKDFESEIPCYLYPEKVISIITSSIKKNASIEENMIYAYKGLYAEKIVSIKELSLLDSWLSLF